MGAEIHRGARPDRETEFSEQELIEAFDTDNVYKLRNNLEALQAKGWPGLQGSTAFHTPDSLIRELDTIVAMAGGGGEFDWSIVNMITNAKPHPKSVLGFRQCLVACLQNLDKWQDRMKNIDESA